MAMAEAKYDLSLVNTQTDKKIYSQPWYKERLRTKYIKSLKPDDQSRFLIGKNWSFLQDGLDDFRDGLPPPNDAGKLIKGRSGPAPNIKGDTESLPKLPNRRRFNKQEVCYSRVTPLMQQRRDHIEEIEYGLTQHPLALYPHLEECLPADMFEDVVDILDPEMNLPSGEEDEDGVVDEDDDYYIESESNSQRLPQVSDKPDTSVPAQEEEVKTRNPYRWLPRREEKDKKDKKKAAERKNHSPSEDAHIKTVTKEFCDWVTSLGGESNNIEESTITSLFASGYETKPAISVPIHVVELTNVPPELRTSAHVPPMSIKKQDSEQDAKPLTGQYEPSWVKHRYGAWYLNPRTWKKMRADEPLKNPRNLKEEEKSESKKKSSKLDHELAALHGSKAFMTFINKKNTRKPEFLERVGEIQTQQAKEEQARQEAEQRKLHHINRKGN